MARRPRFGSRQGKGFFSFLPRPNRLRGHLASYPVGIGDFSPWVKRPEREADHSPPYSAEVKNGGAIPPRSHMSSWRGAYLAEQRDNFTFTPYVGSAVVFVTFMLCSDCISMPMMWCRYCVSANCYRDCQMMLFLTDNIIIVLRVQSAQRETAHSLLMELLLADQVRHYPLHPFQMALQYGILTL
jgi:hypothetical protein